jgi:hypothetical protein
MDLTNFLCMRRESGDGRRVMDYATCKNGREMVTKRIHINEEKKFP